MPTTPGISEILTSGKGGRKVGEAMVVYFLRHAEAEPAAGSDFERKLTVKGLEQAEKVGKFLVRYGLLPDAIITSPVVRAKQTAKIVAKRLGGPGLVEGAWLACGMTAQTCIEELQNYSKMDSVVLVGHEPDFSEAIASLIGLPSPDALNIRKSSLTGVDMAGLAAGEGRLQLLVPVRLM